MAKFTGDNGDNSFVGGADADQATGGGGNDTLIGFGGDDTLEGDAGDDTLDGGDGADLLVGGAGADNLSGGNGDDRLHSYLVTSTARYPNPLTSLDIYADRDVLNGGAGDDYIYAGYGDSVDGGTNGSYGDRLYVSFRGATEGVTADFRLLGTQGSVTIGGATITGVEYIEYIEGTDFDDFLAGWYGGYYPNGGSIYGRGGNDHIIAGYYAGFGSGGIYGGDGDDLIDNRQTGYSPNTYGEAGNDHIIGGSGYELLDGGDGDDVIEGNYGYDTLRGGAGNDVLDGGSFGDNLYGDAGNDTLYGAGDADVIEGGDGDDVIFGDFSPISSAGALSPASNDDRLSGSAGLDTIHGDAGNDTIDGGADADQLFGDAGDDTITGGTGDDRIDGGDGNDTGYGGEGGDVLISGAGTDQFSGEAGDDRLYFGAYFGAGDVAAGGAGADELLLQGDYDLAIGGNVVGIETLRLLSAADASFGGGVAGAGFSYRISLPDALVPALASFAVDASGLGAGETLTLNASAETNGDILVTGGAGADMLVTGAGNDFFDLSRGGDDVSVGGAGNDGFYFGAALTAADRVDGGAGADDQVALQGNYAAGATLGAGVLVGVETLVLLSGSDARFGDRSGASYSYALRAVDANVAAGGLLTVNMNGLRAGESAAFDGSAETDGAFLFFGGAGSDVLTGGAQSDGFYFGAGLFGARDVVMGGPGGADDQLGLQGDYSGANAVTFGFGQLIGIDSIVVLGGADTRFGARAGGSNSYDLTLSDGNVESGATLTINGNTLGAGETLRVNGAAETNGALRIFGGAGADVLTGGAGADTLFGGAGADRLSGGAGSDVFLYLSAADSAASARDVIGGFASGDKIDLSGIDARVGTSANDAFSFIGAGAFTGASGELRAVLANGVWSVEGDTNGDRVADLVIQVGTDGGYALGAGDFNF